MQQELVSVVIPCYNYAAYLGDCIESVLASTYSHIEIIIIDDGSQDQSIEIAQSYAASDARIHLIEQQNGGPSKARNKGISHAQGVYILPLDADDLIDSHYIEAAVAAFQQDVTRKVVYAEARKIGLKEEYWKLKDFSLQALATENMIYVSAFYRKSDWARVGGYTENPVCVREDWDYWIKLLKDGGAVLRLNFVGFYYRIHSLSRRKSMNKQKKNAEIAYLNQAHRDFFYTYLRGPLRVRRSYSKVYNTLLRAFGLLGNS